jgi:hypothetical protein
MSSSWHWKLEDTGYGDVDWIHIAQDRDHWLAVMDMIRSLDSLKGEKYHD